MKKITTAVLMAAITMISFTACKSGSGGKTGDGYVLKMRLAKGDKFSQEMDMTMDMSMSMMGREQKMKMNMEIGTDFEVMDTSTKAKQLKVTYTKMNTKMDLGNPASSAMTDSLMKVTGNGVVGKSVIISIDANKVTDVNGLDQVIAANSSDTNVRKGVEKMFSKENFNSMFGMMFSVYPDKPVKEGDTWTGDNSIDLNGMMMNVKTTYKLLEVRDGIAKVEMNGTIDTKGAMTQGGMNVDMDMKGTQKGTMNIKLADGYLQTGNYDMDIDATMGIGGQKVPMKMKAAYTLNGK